MKYRYDVIIVGARCAGSTLAIELGKAGFGVLLLDQARFPSDTLSTHTFFNNTVHILKELGVADFLEHTNAPIVRHVLFQFDEIQIQGELPIVHNEKRSYCIRRRYFDHALYEKAISSDAVTSLEGFRVRRLLFEGDRVVGVEGVHESGETMQFTANWVVGADGRNSIVRKELRLQPEREIPTDFAFFYSYFTGLEQQPPAKFEVYRIYDRTLVIFPTTDQQFVVFVAFPLTNHAWLDQFKQNPKQAYLRFLSTQFPEISFRSRLAHAKLVEDVKGLIGFNNYWYPGMGKGWALVGDAVIFKDPGVAQGMYDAIQGARILANILKKYSWDRDLETMKNEYEKRLKEEFQELFELGVVLTKNQLISAEQKMVQQLISKHPEATEKFLGIYNRANTIADLNQTIGKILGSMRN
jgi:2-polyprenyl-6-methoxyphenol hydroxylase-like FAD-dependent oxidoreductase